MTFVWIVLAPFVRCAPYFMDGTGLDTWHREHSEYQKRSRAALSSPRCNHRKGRLA